MAVSVKNADADSQAFLNHIRLAMNNAMMKAAEPVIEEAMIKIEKAMRQKLASILIANMEKNLDIRTRDDNLVITLRQFKT